jgi:GntR family transcriptional regulator/MocR family aminotransferase
MDKAVFTSTLVGIVLQTDAAVPMHESLYSQIRDLIVSGKLPRSVRLPSTRTLAEQLGCSRPTVIIAYEHLESEGYLATRQGSGTYVTAVLPEDYLRCGSTAEQDMRAVKEPSVFLSRRGTSLAQIPFLPVESYGTTNTGHPFSPAEPDLSLFPFSTWTAIANRIWKSPRAGLANSDDPAGFVELREAIANYLGIVRGVRCTPDQVVITSGTQHAVDFLARVLLDPGDRVWVEDPTVPHLVQGPLISVGAQPVPIPVDDHGLVVEAAQDIAPDARLAIVTPSNHYPLGVAMSAERRDQLLAWASRARAWVLEDDYDSELCYQGIAPATLYSQDVDERVILVGTFSKVLFRGIRLGYMVLPTKLVPELLVAKRHIGHWTSILTQPTLARFMQEGHFYAHIRRALHVYRERSKVFDDGIRRELGHLFLAKERDRGISAFVEFTEELGQRMSDSHARQCAERAGIEVRAISEYFLGSPTRKGLLLGFGAVPVERILPALLRLGDALSDHREVRKH